MKTDLVTKLLLAAIAVGLFMIAFRTGGTPALAQTNMASPAMSLDTDLKIFLLSVPYRNGVYVGNYDKDARITNLHYEQLP